MKSKYKRYKEYKSLPYPFLDGLPLTWDITPLYALSNFRQGKLHEPYINEDGKFICINARFVSTEGKKFKHCTVNLSPVKKSDILMVMSDLPNGRALAKALYVEGDNNYALNQRVCAITPVKINPKFLYYQLNRNPYFLSFDDGSNQTNLSNYDFKKYPVLYPPLQEQKAIATYLDRATQKIDTLIAKQSSLIALLKEKRQALISHAVTKGVENHNGDWTNYRLDWVSTIIRGNTGFKKDELKNSGEYVALQYGKTYKVDEVNQTFNFYVNSEFYKQRQLVHKGDTILISTSETVEDLGHSCFYNRDDLGLIGGEQILLKPNVELINDKYLYYSSKVFCKELKKYASGLKVFRFNTDDLKKIFISIPSVEEQQEIAKYIDQKTQKIDTLITKATKAITLLKEKRTALISAVVTGKVDVRDAL